MILFLLLSGCGTVNHPTDPSRTFLKTAYVQLDATGSLARISDSAVAVMDVMVLSFANISTTEVSSSFLTSMNSLMSKGRADTVWILSIGGEYVGPTHIAAAGGAAKVVSNIVAQINAYNAALTGGVISGADLDLENGVDADTINDLAKGFKDNGLKVSIAPQIYLSSGSSIEASNPTNMVLTSGGGTNSYGKAIANGYVDYIMVQTYNTGGFTISSYAENQLGFFISAAKALHNARTILSIPAETKVFVGTVSNRGAGGQYTIFNPTAEWPFSSSYDHQSLLDQLKTDIISMESDSANYGNIAGIMFWSLNNDYWPDAPPWNDTYAVKGGFSKTICGAEN